MTTTAKAVTPREPLKTGPKEGGGVTSNPTFSFSQTLLGHGVTWLHPRPFGGFLSTLEGKVDCIVFTRIVVSGFTRCPGK